MSDNKDDFRKKILSVFLFFMVFGTVAYALVFFTGKPSAPKTAETVKPRENPDAMTDPASGTALTYSLDIGGGVSVREGAADVAEAAKDEAPSEEKKSEPVKEKSAKQPEAKAEAPKPAPEKKAETPKPAPKPAEAPKAVQVPAPKPAEVPKAIQTSPKSVEATKAAQAPVKPAAAKPAETKTTAPTPAPAKVKAGMFVIQLSAYRTEAAANEEMNKLRKNFPDIYAVKIDLGEKGVWYRLRTSPSTTQAEAVKKRDAINAKYGFKAIVVKSE